MYEIWDSTSLLGTTEFESGDPSMGVFMKDDREEQRKGLIRDGMEDLRDIVHGNRSLVTGLIMTRVPVRTGSSPLKATDAASLPFTLA